MFTDKLGNSNLLCCFQISVRPFLNDNEYRQTEFVVDTFRTGVGKVLHKKLKDRAESRKNWVGNLSCFCYCD